MFCLTAVLHFYVCTGYNGNALSHIPLDLVGWLVGFLTSPSTTRLYRGRAPRQSVWQFNVLPHMRQSWETMTSVSAGHIRLTLTQPVGSGRPQRGSNPGPSHQESRALPIGADQKRHKFISMLDAVQYSVSIMWPAKAEVMVSPICIVCGST